jgi:membrane-bound metal-dependent hydrolase YbcI (DUF457 family)
MTKINLIEANIKRMFSTCCRTRLATRKPMPNGKTHAQIGAATGAVTYIGMAAHYKREMKLDELGMCAFLGVACAALPDIIEPALSPNHRSVAHSIVILLLVVLFVCWYCGDENGERHEFAKIATAAAAAGYATHLVADACTPKGLPLWS